jgi:phosphoribosylglycinamide formyltransferase 1
MMTFPLSHPARLAVFASGRGSNLEAIIKAFPASHSLASVALVISNKAEAGALGIAKGLGISAYYLDFAERERFEREADSLLGRYDIDLVCLAGFMRLLSAEFAQRWRGRLLNIHPSLLPAFPGLGAQRQALEAGARVSGCTVHFVDEGADSGPIILQRRVPVLPKDTVESLSARILKEEHKAYPEAIKRVLLSKVAYPLEVAE